MKNLIEIVSYDQRWPLEFYTIGMPLREAIGDVAVRIDHIGSTAVPGLAAKDIIMCATERWVAETGYIPGPSDL